MAFPYILLAIAIVAGLGLRLDDAAKVAQDRPQRALDPATDAIALAEGGLKRVYES